MLPLHMVCMIAPQTGRMAAMWSSAAYPVCLGQSPSSHGFDTFLIRLVRQSVWSVHGLLVRLSLVYRLRHFYATFRTQ
jgi:hypothetical protein